MLWVGLFFAMTCAIGRAQSVDERAERYLDAYMMNNEGERLEKAGQLQEALRQFREASKIFDSIAQNHPTWEANMIAMRRRKVADSMARVEGQLDRVPSSGAPTQATSAPVGQSPLAMPGGIAAGSAVPLAGAAASVPGDMPSFGDLVRQYEVQMRERYNALQQRNLEMESALRKWDEWYRWASKEIQGARSEKQALAGRLTELEGRMQQMQREVEAGKASQGQLDTLLKEKAALLALEKQNNARLETAERSAAEAREKLTASTAELAALTKERDQLMAEKEAAMKESAEQKAAREKLESQVAELKKSLTGNEEVKRLTAENERLKGELETAKQQVTALQESVTRKDAEIAKLKTDLGTIQTQLTTLQKENTAYQTQVSELTAQLKSLESGMPRAAEGATDAVAENAMLREVILRQLRQQARQQQAKALVIAELKKLEGASATLLEQVEQLDTGRLTLTEQEEKLFTDPQAQELLKAGSGAVQAKLMASGTPEGEASSKDESNSAAGPSTTDALLAKATEALKARDFEAAIEGFNEALRADPKNAVALIGLGDAYQRSGQFAEAEVALKKCLTYTPDSAPAYQTLGMTYFRSNRLTEAMSAFEESLKRDSKQALAHHYLGIIASRLKQGERAEKEFRTALAINPSFGEAHFNLAVLYVSWEPPQWDKAREEYQSAMSKGVLPDEALEKLLKQ